jgi:ketosteroid isomerase-like protein
MTSRWIGMLLAAGVAWGGVEVDAQSPRTGPDGPSPSSTEATLAALDAAIQQASVTGDAALLERHLADDFAFTHFGGGRDDKAHWLGLARRDPRPYRRRAVSEQRVEAHGDVALVLGRLDVETTPRPAPASGGQADAGPACYALRYVHVYARRDGAWTFLSHHTTSMIEESHPCR